MCRYMTFHWSCCPGTAAPAPYYLHAECELAQAPRRIGYIKKKCRIEYEILDGADYDESCPKCGQKASDREADEDDQVEIEPLEAVSCSDAVRIAACD